MGLHTGECGHLDGDLYGRAVNKAARIEQAVGHAGAPVGCHREMVRDKLEDGLSLAYLGEHHFDGMVDPERVYQLSVAEVSSTTPHCGRVTSASSSYLPSCRR